MTKIFKNRTKFFSVRDFPSVTQLLNFHKVVKEFSLFRRIQF